MHFPPQAFIWRIAQLVPADPAKPVHGAFKAVLVDATTRVACTSANCMEGGSSEHLDWVVTAATPYMNTAGAIIGTTTAEALFTSELSASVGTMDLADWNGLTIEQSLFSAFSSGNTLWCGGESAFYCVEQ